MAKLEQRVKCIERMKNFIDIKHISKEEILNLIQKAIKRKNSSTERISNFAQNKVLALIFEKQSTRTRLSFDIAMKQIGGSSINMDMNGMHLGNGTESLSDTAKVLSLYVDAAVLRVNKHNALLEIARNSSIPIINGLSDISHPCQTMAGLMTLMEIKKTLTNLNLVWLGPITNVAHSWIEAFMKNLGFSLKIICPNESKEIYEKKCNEYAIDLPKENIILSDLSEEILNTADAILTDTWVSMGEEGSDSYIDKLKDYRVRESIMKKTKNSCTFMHCLPVNRNQEVEASVIDGPSSSVWLEAENRLHIQKEILLDCL